MKIGYVTLELRIEPAAEDGTLTDWQHVHNTIVPAAAMTLDEARERVGWYLLEVAYLGDVLVACTTVRPPEDGNSATVIVRVLPEHRRQGYGEFLYQRAMQQALSFGTKEIETIVWASNVDGLRFAQSRGFAEVSSYLPEGEDVPYLTLAIARDRL